jgi:hypothetical protein
LKTSKLNTLPVKLLSLLAFDSAAFWEVSLTQLKDSIEEAGLRLGKFTILPYFGWSASSF